MTVLDDEPNPKYFYDNTAGQNVPWQIGRGYGADQYFNGVLDEFAIFNKMLTWTTSSGTRMFRTMTTTAWGGSRTEKGADRWARA